MHRPAFAARALEALRVRDAAARGHPVHLTGTNGLLHAGRVAVHDLAGKQVGDRGKSDVRMRSNIRCTRQSLRQVNRTEMIEEYEGAHHPTLRVRQHSPDLEVAEIAAPLVYEKGPHPLSLLRASHARSRGPQCAGGVPSGTRVCSVIQLTSQVLPPSCENACSKCGAVELMLDHTNRT